LKKKIFGILIALALITAIAIPMAVSATPTTTPISGSGNITVSGIPTSITLTSNSNPSYYRQGLTLNVVITPSTGSANVTGTTNLGMAPSAAPSTDGFITIMNGSTPLAASGTSVSIPTGNTSLHVSFVDVTPPLGSYTLTAVYDGDSNYAGSTSTVVNETVLPQYAYTLSSSTVVFGNSTAVVGSTINITSAPITVTNTGYTPITGYTVTGITSPTGLTSNSLTVTGSSTLLSNSSGIGAGTSVAGNGGTETITFTLNATVEAGEANQTINLSGLSFTLTPQ